MQGRVLRRAATAAVSMVILASLIAYADTVPADGDSIVAGDQIDITLPPASPGEVVVRQVTFRLLCGGTTHATPGSTISLTYDSATAPGDGAAEATDTTIGVPTGWAANGCPSPAPSIPANSPATVTLTMPTTAGPNQEFTLMWARSGSSGLTGMTTLTFRVDVIGNRPPTLHLPDNLLVEATSAAGAAVSWTATATDAEDSTPPAVTCTPPSGETFPIGITTVKCWAADSAGLKTNGSFLVTVQDTTGPTLHGTPNDISVTTDDPSGAVVSWTDPTATDLVDPSPTVGCDPPSGHKFSIGTWPVTCTALDATGNSSERSFHVTVALASPVAWSAIWGEPVATDGSTFVANPGRTVPVKVHILADGVEQTSGHATLAIATCAGAPVGSLPMTWGGGRWNASLDTGSLGGPGCYVATATLDGQAAGSFRIDLRGADPASNNGSRGKGRS